MLKSLGNDDKPLTLGILGGGQLAKMLASAAYRMGINVAIIENHDHSPAGDMTKNDFYHGWENADDLEKFIEKSDIITLENEFISPDILEKIEKSKKVYPDSKTMRLVQDKFIQKNTFQNAGLPIPVFTSLDTIEEALKFGKINGYPFVIKSRKMGYDGYGNATIDSPLAITPAWNKFKADPLRSDLMAEKFVYFTKELAVMVARSTNGETAVYPCVETIQKNHICHSVMAPAMIDDELQEMAKKISVKAVEAIDGVGVFGVELFLTNDNQILINEIAPRPHNSGHYTIECCYCSQYENAIRAICGLPLGSTEMIKPGGAMVNLLGIRDGSGVPSDITKTLAHNEVWLHLYNKKSSRNGRKMGHITAMADTPEMALEKATLAANDIIW
jgi:5-(carboxyamino)imidazole ribonucleotide synthase